MMKEIDLGTVLEELDAEVEANEKQQNINCFLEQLKKRQRYCDYKTLSKHLISPNYKPSKKPQSSLCAIIKTRNNRISKAAKDLLFGNICQSPSLSPPTIQLLSLTITTQSTSLHFPLQNKHFKQDKIHIKLKQGTIYQASIKFVVYNDIVNGLRVINNVNRLFVRVQEEDVLGSFGPKKGEQEMELEERFMPQGFFVRGDWKGKMVVMDNQGVVHCQLSYKLTITK